jgi:hypothetical protein
MTEKFKVIFYPHGWDAGIARYNNCTNPVRFVNDIAIQFTTEDGRTVVSSLPFLLEYYTAATNA